jgi:hypothetical protein
MLTRRDFLHLTSLAAPGFFLLPIQDGRNLNPNGELTFGLFFDAENLKNLRKNFSENPIFAALRQRLASFDRAGMRGFIKSEVRYNDHLYHIVRLSDAAQQMAFYYLLAGDKDAAALSTACIRTIMKFPRWDYFLEAGKEVIGIQRASSTLMAVALCADWLGNFVSKNERAEWLSAMGEKGCEACFRSLYGMRYPDRVVGWSMDPTSTYFEHRPGDRVNLSNWPHILDKTNLKAVPASALTVGAVAYQQQFSASEKTERWLEQAVFSLSTFRDLFARDGSYNEGVSYANYTALHLAQATSVLHRLQTIDLHDLINWPGYVDYVLGMAMPVNDDPYEIVNFGDNGNPKSGEAGKPKRTAVPFWVAGHFRDHRAQWFGENLGGEHDEWALIWYKSSIPAEAPPAGPQLWHSDLDWIVARTGYNPEDLVVAMRSGGPSNHEHADRNSIIVKWHGEHLVADPYRPPYSFSDASWMMRTTAGHSALLIDGKPHQYHDGSEGTNPSDAVARIVRKGERAGYIHWTSDATPAYQLVLPDVKSVTRTVVVLHEFPAVFIFDKVLKTAQPSRIQARFFAYNLDGKGGILAESNGFKTMRPQAKLQAVAAGNSEISVEALQLPIPEENAAKHPFAEVSTQRPRLAPFLVTVLLPERHTAPGASAQITFGSDNTYMITLRNAEREMRCRVFDTGTIPEFDFDS